MEEIKTLSDEHLELQKQIKQLTLKDELIKNKIKVIMESQNIDKLDVDDYVIGLHYSEGRKTLDKKLVETFLGEKIHECYKIGNGFSTLRWDIKRQSDE